jgi:hypothetical protein
LMAPFDSWKYWDTALCIECRRVDITILHQSYWNIPIYWSSYHAWWFRKIEFREWSPHLISKSFLNNCILMVAFVIPHYLSPFLIGPINMTLGLLHSFLFVFETHGSFLIQIFLTSPESFSRLSMVLTLTLRFKSFLICRQVMFLFLFTERITWLSSFEVVFRLDPNPGKLSI